MSQKDYELIAHAIAVTRNQSDDPTWQAAIDAIASNVGAELKRMHTGYPWKQSKWDQATGRRNA